ncbi:hypothetical protein LSUB1_G002639, partial [Lachnellula subtilissima]
RAIARPFKNNLYSSHVHKCCLNLPLTTPPLRPLTISCVYAGRIKSVQAVWTKLLAAGAHQIPILAPIHNADICPLWSERWELRTRPLGCHVSTITFLTCILSVLATFLAVGFTVVGFKVGWRIQANWKTRSEGWWKIWSRYRPGWWGGLRLRLIDIRDTEAERPLLISHG